MNAHCTTIAPFRIAEGEQTAESCAPRDAIGWMTYRDGGPVYYYKRKRDAAAASETLETGGTPLGGSAWWPRRTIYLA